MEEMYVATRAGTKERCFFCERNPVDDAGVLHKKIFKVVEKAAFGNKVKYQELNVAIPRCTACKEMHARADKGNGWLMLILMVCGLGAGIYLSQSDLANGLFSEDRRMVILTCICSTVAGILLAAGIGNIRKRSRAGKFEIRDDTDRTLKQHPHLREAMAEGWTFQEP